jgi:hypothetical protein
MSLSSSVCAVSCSEILRARVGVVDPGEARELRHLRNHLLVIDRVERILLRQLRGHQAQEIALPHLLCRPLG